MKCKSPPPILEHLQRALNEHDVTALADCLQAGYVNTHPAHPERNTLGRETACQRWAVTFACVPNLRAELLRFAQSGSTLWTEWAFSNDSACGPVYRAGGVMIFGLQGDRIAWARTFTEAQPIEGPDWDRILDEALQAGCSALDRRTDDLAAGSEG